MIQRAPAQPGAGSPPVARACPLAERSNDREPRAEFSASTLKAARLCRGPANLFSSPSVMLRIDLALHGLREHCIHGQGSAPGRVILGHSPDCIRRRLTMANQRRALRSFCRLGLSRRFGGPRSDLLLLANRGQLEMFLLDERIFGCFGRLGY